MVLTDQNNRLKLVTACRYMNCNFMYCVWTGQKDNLLHSCWHTCSRVLHCEQDVFTAMSARLSAWGLHPWLHSHHLNILRRQVVSACNCTLCSRHCRQHCHSQREVSKHVTGRLKLNGALAFAGTTFLCILVTDFFELRTASHFCMPVVPRCESMCAISALLAIALQGQHVMPEYNP